MKAAAAVVLVYGSQHWCKQGRGGGCPLSTMFPRRKIHIHVWKKYRGLLSSCGSNATLWFYCNCIILCFWSSKASTMKSAPAFIPFPNDTAQSHLSHHGCYDPLSSYFFVEYERNCQTKNMARRILCRMPLSGTASAAHTSFFSSDSYHMIDPVMAKFCCSNFW